MCLKTLHYSFLLLGGCRYIYIYMHLDNRVYIVIIHSKVSSFISFNYVVVFFFLLYIYIYNIIILLDLFLKIIRPTSPLFLTETSFKHDLHPAPVFFSSSIFLYFLGGWDSRYYNKIMGYCPCLWGIGILKEGNQTIMERV